MSPEELLSLGFSKELVVLIIAALPIFELRGALPVAINLFHFPWYYALPLAIIGNLLPVPFIRKPLPLTCRKWAVLSLELDREKARPVLCITF